MKRLLFLVLPALMLLASPAAAQNTIAAQVVATCGTPNNTPVVGNAYPLTQDTTLTLCTAGGGGGGGGGAVTIANGADVTQGAVADTAWSGTGSGTNNAILKSIRGLLAGTLTVGTHAVTQSGAWTFSLSAALPAGTNNIGDVDVLSLPALPAGTNNIGDVDVLTMPALAAGSNIIGNVRIDQTTNGTTNAVAIKDSAGALVDWTAPVPVYSAAGTTTDASSTVTTGGTFQTVFASSSTRRGCLIQNPITASETLFVYEGTGTATTAKSINLAPGATFNCGAPGLVVTGLVQVTGATTAHAFVAKSQ